MMPRALARLAGAKPHPAKAGFARIFNPAIGAGPRRLAILTLALLCLLGLVVAVVAMGRHAPIASRDARMKPVDPLPGGLHGNPEQDALALEAGETRAQAALRSGASFTPPLAPSVKVVPSPPQVEQAAPQAVVRPRAAQPGVRVSGAPVRASFPAPIAPDPTAAQPRPIEVAAAGNPQANAAYSREVGNLFSQWGGRLPQTDIVLPPPAVPSAAAAAAARPATAPASAATKDPGVILIPAGRGVFAHPILAVNSDATSPVVLQADSGPIAGDRMIGTFARQNDRLVIHINTVIHQGRNLSVDGLVVAPETMEAGVASGVDQHYLTRFVLPAAAAFVQGLGEALATTSNTTAVLSPLGGASYVTQLNLPQQLGVAAGVAAGQVGAALNAAAPKGPTVTLDANVAVGVMFLSNVTLPPAS
jgi:intracellular multiplication protein IcmE